MSKYGTNGSGIFLSTPSARRATSFSMRLRLPTRNFYPRPPRGGRHDLRAGQGPRSEISIHALREEGDRIRHGPAGREVYFYPRPPRGGRRLRPAPEHACGLISIHALREEGDSPGSTTTAAGNNFYPRPPRGGRLEHIRAEVRRHQISIHALREEGDLYPSRSRHIRLISIHALREEGDPLPPGPAAEHKDFYPRPPRGGRPLRFCPSAPEKNDFYPRPPRGGRRSYGSPQKSLHPFLSTPSARRATSCIGDSII